jgi:D-glycero-beta-D-manno-heptose-7-phosphate kinase
VKDELRRIISAWQGKRLLVLGDMVADEHVVGRPLQIAREAPVLVLEHVDTRLLPGGATNLAANARALGAEVSLCGVVGDDQIGQALVTRLRAAGMSCEGVAVDPDRPTTTKTRIWAGGAQQQIQQLMLRLDRVDRRPIGAGMTEQMAAYVTDALDQVDALMISDYENGVIHPGLIEASLPAAMGRGRLVTVDSHGDLQRFRGASLFTPNQPEAEATLGRRLTTRADLETGGRELVERLDAQAVLITRGQEGMSLFTRGGKVHHLPTPDSLTAVDPTGAGDTVAATFTLAVAAGAILEDAVLLASLAASIVVARVGTATASVEDLDRAIEGLRV